MKIVATIARYLLGLMFLIFGLNSFLMFIKGQMPSGPAGEFAGLLMTTHYAQVVGAIEILCAVLFLANRYVPLALVLLGPILVNILLFHILMAPATIGPGVFVTLLWLLVAYHVRSAFVPLLRSRAQG
jgi:putative oxidoreductase